LQHAGTLSMAKSIDSQISFAGGEFSPKLDARVDQEKYRAASRQMVNMIPYKQGPVTRRPGTQFIAAAKSGSYSHTVGGVTTITNYATRLEKFIYSPDTTFILEFGHEYIRFYSNGQQVNVSSAPVWADPADTIITAGNFNVGVVYVIESIGTTDFTLCGAASNTVGIAFTATNAGTGTGTAGQSTAYAAGSYITSPTNSLIYYVTIAGYAPVDPVYQPSRFIQQTILEVPSPYQASYTTNNIGLTASPYSTDIWKLAFCQVNDVMYITHPDYPVYSLTRYSDTDWVMKEVQFLTPALLDQNANQTTLTASSTSGAITLTANAPAWTSYNFYEVGNTVSNGGNIYQCLIQNNSSPSFPADLAAGLWELVTIFQAPSGSNQGHVNSYWQIATLRSSSSVEIDASTPSAPFPIGYSQQIEIYGAWEAHTYGVWNAQFNIERSMDGGQTWDAVRSVSGASDRNVDITGTAQEPALFRINVLSSSAPTTAGATNPRIVLEAEDGFLYGLVQITGVTGPYTATANVIQQLYDNAPLAALWVSGTAYTTGTVVNYGSQNFVCISNVTSSTVPPADSTHWSPEGPTTEYWSEGAWSDYRGYPQAVASYQQRIIYASSAYQPQRIWGSVTNDIENFALGDQTQATDSFAFDLNAPGRGPIVWLVAQNNLFAGFSGAEWVVNGGAGSAGSSTGGAITPTSISATEHSTWGSIFGVNPLVVGDGVLFLQRQANQIRQMLFSVYTEKYMSQSLTTYSSHLFNTGIVQLDYQPMWHGQSELWAVTQQGQLCGMTYEMEQNVFGWHRHTTGTNSNTPDFNTPDVGFQSVAVVYGKGYADDEVWVVANRYTTPPLWNNGTRYYSNRDVYAFNNMVSYNGNNYVCIAPAPNYSVQSNTPPDHDHTNWLGVAPYTYGQNYIERINPNNWEQEWSSAPNNSVANVSDAFYVDSGITVTNNVSNVVSGLGNLAGRWVVGLADGYAFGPIQVGYTSSDYGTITIPYATSPSVVNVGLPITYTAQAMRYDSDARAGNTQGLVKQISDVFIRVWNSLGGNIANKASGPAAWISLQPYSQGSQVSYNGVYYQVITTGVASAVPPPSDPTNWKPYGGYLALPVPIPYGNLANPFASPQSNFISTPTDIRITPQLNLTPDTDPIIIVTGSDALPLTVLAVIIKYEVIATP